MQGKILIADDNAITRSALEQLLQAEGYDVAVVDNGQLAMDKIVTWRPELVMLDVRMSDKNGYEVCREVKSEPSLQHLPVVLLFNENEPLDLNLARDVGATRCVPKTLAPHSLLMILNFIWGGLSAPRETFSAITSEEDNIPELEVEPIVDGEGIDTEIEHYHQLFEIKITSPLDENLIESTTKETYLDSRNGNIHLSRKASVNELHSMVETSTTMVVREDVSLPDNGEPILDGFDLDFPYHSIPVVAEEENGDDLLEIKEELITYHCDECGTPVKLGDIFCLECGAVVDTDIFTTPLHCLHCNHSLSAGDIFCLNCGSVQ
jgi:twitching motility two-component system response regulator PilH